jgi:phospholipid-translocating ATPase
VLIVSLKLALYTQYWTIVNIIALFGLSLFIYYMYILISDDISSAWTYKLAISILSTPHFHLGLLLIIGFVMMFDVVCKILFDIPRKKAGIL